MDELDDQIAEMYERVTVPFLQIAAERRENISRETLNKIVVKFLLIAQTMGDDSVEDHLAYELDKYRREGLRSDYR